MTKFPNLKQWSPAGDLDMKQDAHMKAIFPHNIKKVGGAGRPSSYIPAKSLKEATGLPTPVETHVAPGLGSAGPSGKKSVAWKAVVCKDETMTGEMAGRQMANVTTVATTDQGVKTAGSKFSARVGPRGPQGVNTGSDMEKFMFGHKNMRVSNLEGSGVSARTTRWAANVRTAPGKQITTREETFGGGVLKNKKVRNI